jgi:HAMP domain-containing protein
MDSMEPEERDKIWRRAVVIVCAISLLLSALAFYGIKRLEAQSRPRVHLIREVDRYRVDTKK